MFYQNSDVKEPHLMFIGRWHPLHPGHIAMIEKVRKEKQLPILMMVRDTEFDDTHALLRAQRIEIWMRKNNIRGSIMIIPDIEGVYFGRSVGYNVEQVHLDKEIEAISGTKIRAEMKKTMIKKWR